MKVSYKKLWKPLIDKDMKKRDLERCAGIRACLKKGGDCAKATK